MTGSGSLSAGMLEQHRVVLGTLRDLLATIGSANDAEDHGYGEDAERMREDACEAIRGLMAEHVFLVEFFPKLLWELDTNHILGFGWAELCDSVDVHLKV